MLMRFIDRHAYADFGRKLKLIKSKYQVSLSLWYLGDEEVI